MPKKLTWIVIPSVVTLMLGILLFTGAAQALELKIYDLLLRIRPAPKELESIVLMDFDDASIAEAGSWPVSRNIYGDGLILLAELGAQYAVFDIEYVDNSPRGINTEFLENDLPAVFKEKFDGLGSNIGQLFRAITGGKVSPKEAAPFVQDLIGMTSATSSELMDNVAQVARNNDEYLGRAARIFGNSYFPVNLPKDASPNGEEAAIEIVKNLAAVQATFTNGKSIRQAKAIVPAISPISGRAGGAGFPNVHIDEDGVRRRIDLFFEYDGHAYAQLVLAPLLRYFGNPAVKISKNFVELKGARYPGGRTTDIKIPRGEDGRMFIDWPHKGFISSYRHIAFRELIVHKKLYSDLLNNLRIGDGWGYLGLYDGERPLMDQARTIESYLQALMDEAADGPLPDGAVADYRKARDAFLSEFGRYFSTNPEQSFQKEISTALANPNLDAASRTQYETIASNMPLYFSNTKKILADLTDLRGRLAKALDGTFCILGQTGTATSDIGVNPFEGEYMNVGTHASVLNTIYQGKFIDDTPAWIPFLIIAASCFGLAFIVRNRKPAVAIWIGAGSTIVLAGCLVAIFALTGIFIVIAQPLIAVFLTFLASTIVSFLKTEREKGFLRNAFSRYLSDEVIKAIVNNPDKLKLGGEKRHMTAMFTDIRGFSTVSEKLAPEGLVTLLNKYLTAMSDIILDLGGTIDKYEGDAIIAFFNAPLELPAHARLASLAAVRMKRAERKLNADLAQTQGASNELLTRLGLNTGDMIVGNMGTDRKMDYTIIGDAVNLAARLEGVNKQYGTWICASEDTIAEAGDDFVVRRLDRIRVVGKSVPIRIYEIIEEKSQAGTAYDAMISQFEEGIELFAAKDWKGAVKAFEQTLVLQPNDGPSKTFIERCKVYMVTPPPADWDGVFNLTLK